MHFATGRRAHEGAANDILVGAEAPYISEINGDGPAGNMANRISGGVETIQKAVTHRLRATIQTEQETNTEEGVRNPINFVRPIPFP